MAYSIAQVNVAANATFQVLFDQLNKAINAISNFVVTVDTTSNGALNTGSVYPNILYIGNSTINTVINTSFITTNTANLLNIVIGNILANTTVFQVGANVVANTTVFKVGNVVANTTMLTVGGSNVVTVATRAVVAKANTLIGSEPRINFIEGNNVTIGVADDGTQINVTVAASPASNSLPGGSNTYIQFNDSGALAGGSQLTWDKVNQKFTVSNTIQTNSVVINCVSYFPAVVTVSSNALFTLDSFFMQNYRTAEYTVSVTDNSTNAYQASKILIVHNGGTPVMTEYAQLFTNTIVAIMSLSSNATHVFLQADPVTSSNVTFKFNKELIGV